MVGAGQADEASVRRGRQEGSFARSHHQVPLSVDEHDPARVGREAGQERLAGQAAEGLGHPALGQA